MGIVFYCQSCGARFEVDARMAGKKGHCKKCGQMMAIPRAEQIASMASMPALAMAGAGGASVSPGASIGSMLKADVSKIGLAPITIDRMPIGPKSRKPGPSKPTAMSVLDDGEDSKPYMLAHPLPKGTDRVQGQANNALAFWRRQIGVIQKLFRSLNETAYLLSIPFVVILLVGIVLKSRNVALFGATFAVVLNVGRIFAGIANLAAVPLRSGLDSGKLKKPIRRVVEPVVTIGLILAAFTFIPWLSSDASSKGTIGQRLRANAKGLRGEMKEKVRKTADGVSNLDLDEMSTRAEEKLKKIGTDLGERVRGTSEEPR